MDNLLEINGLAELIDDLILDINRSHIDADFNEFRRKLILGKPHEMPFHLFEDISTDHVFKLGKHLGYDEVPVCILNVFESVVQDLFDNKFLRFGVPRVLD